jgi:hypothetical protein
MKQTILMNLTRLTLTILAFTFAAAAQPQIDIPGPAGSGAFGTQIFSLPNGNFVVTDPGYDITTPALIQNVGAVYLYNGATGALISTLTGSKANDQIGSNGGPNPVTILNNGNYVVSSWIWDNGAIADAGAATFCSGATGCSGFVSASNSLVGSTASDRVGAVVRSLNNGNYVVASLSWDNGAAVDAGAVTFGNGTTGISGTVSAANSLVGSTTFDSVGGVTVLPNGNYVVNSTGWDNGAIVNAGAVTFGNGTTGITGTISASNSLVGLSANDTVGGGGGFGISMTVLTNGNYVVSSPLWNNGATADVGAATFCSGTSGCHGTISVANSLIGSTAGDAVGGGQRGTTALTNGNYVVSSPVWDNDTIVDAGAATFSNGTTGITGVVSAANSLVGSTANDRVSGGAGVNPSFEDIVPLTNGNYVVSSQNWDNGAIANAGAATFGNGTTGITGVVSAGNSLVGSTAGDQVSGNSFGISSIIPLTNGNYVVGSPKWRNAGILNAGAATLGNGTTGTTGVVSAANSLVGSTADDQISASNGGVIGLVALTNGNYVVGSPLWNNGAIVDAGAATFGNGTTGVTGTISVANSLIGSTANDNVGGNFTSGTVTTALSNGNYVVVSPFWNNGAIADAGAATFGNGTTGTTGTISASNSLVGSTASDQVGSGGATALINGTYLVRSPLWNNGATADVGAVTFGNRNGTTVGAVTADNSVRGTTASGGNSIRVVFDAVNRQIIVGRPADNIVTLFRPIGLTEARRTPFDFDGDGRADISVFRPMPEPSSNFWYVLQSSANTLSAYEWGIQTDRLVPADYDGDGRTDYAVYRGDGEWHINQSSNSQFRAVRFGLSEDIPVPGDFDGDERADIAVFRPSSGIWYRLNSGNSQFVAVQFGQSGDRPLIGDYDGDAKSDLTVFRPSDGAWYRLNSLNGQFVTAQFGASGDIPVNGDFNGDGRSDLAVFRPASGFWYVARPTGTPSQNFEATQFGISTDMPVPADYDGDAKADIAVYRGDGEWYLLRTTAGFGAFRFGLGSDKAIPNSYIIP